MAREAIAAQAITVLPVPGGAIRTLVSSSTDSPYSGGLFSPELE